MSNIYRELFKHSSIYALGQVLSRMASLLLLPVYTRYLSTEDYGCIAILDLTVGILGILIGGGMAQTIGRFHFSASDDAERNEIWWTGSTVLVCACLAVVIPAWFLRGDVARLTLGADVPGGGYFYALLLPTLWFNSICAPMETYLRVQKWSGVAVLVSFGRLLLNIALNVCFLAVFRMGVAGILLGNLVSGAVTFVILLGLFLVGRGPYAFSIRTARRLCLFGAPLMVSSVLALIMHQADRYFLRTYQELEQVGIYSLAYQIGQGINTLLFVPFMATWGVIRYEIADRPNAKAIYITTFHYFVSGLVLFMLMVSLFAYPLLGLLATPAFSGAADLIPVVCLGYFFFTVSDFFSLPLILHNQTSKLLPGGVLAALTNLGANFLLVPGLGNTGAALATVLTFVVLASVNLILGRRTDAINFRLGAMLAVLATAVVIFILFRRLQEVPLSMGLYCSLAGAVTFLFAAVLFGVPLVSLFRGWFTAAGQAALGLRQSVDSGPCQGG